MLQKLMKKDNREPEKEDKSVKTQTPLLDAVNTHVVIEKV